MKIGTILNEKKAMEKEVGMGSKSINGKNKKKGNFSFKPIATVKKPQIEDEKEKIA